jgi:hypothetical protein
MSQMTPCYANDVTESTERQGPGSGEVAGLVPEICLIASPAAGWRDARGNAARHV